MLREEIVKIKYRILAKQTLNDNFLAFYIHKFIRIYIYFFKSKFINLREFQSTILNIYIIFVLKTRHNIILASILTGIQKCIDNML